MCVSLLVTYNDCFCDAYIIRKQFRNLEETLKDVMFNVLSEHIKNCKTYSKTKKLYDVVKESRKLFLTSLFIQKITKANDLFDSDYVYRLKQSSSCDLSLIKNTDCCFVCDFRISSCRKDNVIFCVKKAFGNTYSEVINYIKNNGNKFSVKGW